MKDREIIQGGILLHLMQCNRLLVKHNIPFVRPLKINRPQVRLKAVSYTEIVCNFFKNPMYPHPLTFDYRKS